MTLLGSWLWKLELNSIFLLSHVLPVTVSAKKLRIINSQEKRMKPINQAKFLSHTWIVAMASTAPAAPSKWPIIDLVEFTLSCTTAQKRLGLRLNFRKIDKEHKLPRRRLGHLICPDRHLMRVQNKIVPLIFSGTSGLPPKTRIKALYSCKSPALVDVAWAFT